MKIESQVCSLELAERLSELGAEQKSSLFWYSSNADTEWLIDQYRCGPQNVVASFCYSAFTVAELGAMLPSYVKTWRWHDLDKGGREYWNCESEKYHVQENADTEADARAKMLIYLIEQQIVTLA